MAPENPVKQIIYQGNQGRRVTCYLMVLCGNFFIFLAFISSWWMKCCIMHQCTVSVYINVVCIYSLCTLMNKIYMCTYIYIYRHFLLRKAGTGRTILMNFHVGCSEFHFSCWLFLWQCVTPASLKWPGVIESPECPESPVALWRVQLHIPSLPHGWMPSQSCKGAVFKHKFLYLKIWKKQLKCSGISLRQLVEVTCTRLMLLHF